MKLDYENPPQTLKDAKKRWPSCAVYKKVEGGYAAWVYVIDYQKWRKQK